MTAAALLLTRAALVTCDAAFTIHDPGWLATDENGAISALGGGTPPAELTAVEQIDCGGDVVMPGMVNTHCHMAMSLLRGLGDDEPDRLERYIFPLEARFVAPEMVRLGSLHAGIELAEGGVTTVADMYYFEDEVARACDEIGLRAVLGQTVMDRPTPDAATADEAFERFEGLADVCKGRPLLTPSLAPHAPHTCGAVLLQRVADRSDGAILVQIHLAEVPAEIAWARETHGTSPVGVLARAGLLGPFVIGAHGLLIDNDDIARLAATGTAISHNAGSNAKAGKGIAPILDLLNAGVPVGLGSDGAMSGNTLDLFAQLPQVAKLAKLRAGDRRLMPARRVLSLATREGAMSLGLGDAVGSLEVGKQADVIRVDMTAPRMRPRHDLASLLVYSACAADVRDVWVAGRRIVKDRRACLVDRDGALTAGDTLAAEMAGSIS